MKLVSMVEALLISSQEPLESEAMAGMIRAVVAEAREESGAVEEGGEAGVVGLEAFGGVTGVEVRAAIGELVAACESEGRSYTILERAHGWRIYTLPAYAGFVAQLHPGGKRQRLSGPAMETLAIIAYRQPITKSAIEAVRGVSCDGMIQKLLDFELISIGGRADLPGRPLLYETTTAFFEYFGIKSVDELPCSGELKGQTMVEAAAGEGDGGYQGGLLPEEPRVEG